LGNKELDGSKGRSGGWNMIAARRLIVARQRV
jgi:hypothetical protein